MKTHLVKTKQLQQLAVFGLLALIVLESLTACGRIRATQADEEEVELGSLVYGLNGEEADTLSSSIPSSEQGVRSTTATSGSRGLKFMGPYGRGGIYCARNNRTYGHVPGFTYTVRLVGNYWRWVHPAHASHCTY